MTTILHIDSSVESLDASFSRRISSALVKAIVGQNAGAEVIRRDLAADPILHITGDLRDGWMTAAENRSPQQIDIVTRSEGYIAELKRADFLVIGAPMYNFSIPSSLKAWIDHVLIAGQTFSYTEKGPEGMIQGKKAFVALARGGVYSEGATVAFDHQGSYLMGALAFIGITDLTPYIVEGTALSPEAATRALEKQLAAIKTGSFSA